MPRLRSLWLSLWYFRSGDFAVSIRLRQPLTALVFGLAFAWYVVFPTEVAAMLAAALGGLVLCAYLWARQMALRIYATRKLRYAAFQVGDELEEQVHVENYSFLPGLWIEVVDRSHIPGYSIAEARAVDGSGSNEWTNSTICARRGVFRLGPWELHMGDPFGLFEVIQVYGKQEEIVVYPPLAILPPTVLPHSLSVGSHRPLRQPLHAESILANTVRAYQTGDPLRHIHWPTTARREKPFVKQFDPESSSNVWILPDLDGAVQVGTGDDSTLERMIILAASLASHLLQEQLAVGLVAFPDLPWQPVLPQRSPAHLWTILRALAPLEPSRQPLAETLARVPAVVSGQDLLIVLTPSLDPAWGRALRALNKGRRAGPVEVLLLDPYSFMPPAPVLEGASPNPGAAVPTLAHSRPGQNAADDLTALGIPTHLVRKNEIRPLAGSHGTLRRWEFTTLGTGRVVVRQTPREAAEAHQGLAGMLSGRGKGS